MLNSIVLAGNLGGDPEIHFMQPPDRVKLEPWFGFFFPINPISNLVNVVL
jgi:hypothetical protein